MKNALAALLLISAPAFAALSPYYNSVRQIQTVLESDVVGINESVVSIESIGSLQYRISGSHCTRVVTLKSIVPEPPIVGPTSYEVSGITALVCR